MAFRIQDLMTDVLPSPVRWASCPGGTTCRGEGYFAAGSKGGYEKPPNCPPVSRGGHSPKPNPKPPKPPADYADLARLQQQLQRALEGPRA